MKCQCNLWNVTVNIVYNIVDNVLDLIEISIAILQSNIFVQFSIFKLHTSIGFVKDCTASISAPLWCELGFVPDSRGNKAAANLRPEMVKRYWLQYDGQLLLHWRKD